LLRLTYMYRLCKVKPVPTRVRWILALSLSMRRDSEVPLEAESGIHMPGRMNFSHLALELGCCKGYKATCSLEASFNLKLVMVVSRLVVSNFLRFTGTLQSFHCTLFFSSPNFNTQLNSSTPSSNSSQSQLFPPKSTILPAQKNGR
jgi:hypothetical protein